MRKVSLIFFGAIAGAGLIISGILWNLRSETRRPVAVGTIAPAGRSAGPESR